MCLQCCYIVTCSREQIDHIDTKPPVPISLEQIKQKARIENEYLQPGILIPDAFQHIGIFPWFCNINPQALQKWL